MFCRSDPMLGGVGIGLPAAWPAAVLFVRRRAGMPAVSTALSPCRCVGRHSDRPLRRPSREQAYVGPAHSARSRSRRRSCAAVGRNGIAALQAASAQNTRSMGFHPNCIASHSMSLRSLRAFGSARRTACLTAPGQSFACRTARSMRCRCTCLGSGPRPERLSRSERMRQAARFSQRGPARSSYQATSTKRVTPQASTGLQSSPGHGQVTAGT